MSGSQDFIPFSNSVDSPRGHNRNNWNKRSPFQHNKFQQNSFSPYNKRNNFNNSSKKFHGQQRFVLSGGDADISAYYHPSMMEDPWKHLYKHMNKNKSSEETTPAAQVNNSPQQSDVRQNESSTSNKSSSDTD